MKLTFRKEDFKEIYFREENGKLFFSNEAKSTSWTALGFLIVTIVFGGYEYFMEGVLNYSIILIIATIIGGVTVYNRIKGKLAWNKSVIAFIDSQSKIRNHELILSENSFSLIQDDKEVSESWSSLKKVESEGNFINLTAENYYVFPRKSFEEQDFDEFVIFVKRKFQN